MNLIRGLLWLCLLGVTPAHAAVRAWLSPTEVRAGESLTLSIETDEQLSAVPDLSPLQADFEVLGQNSSSQIAITNGVRSVRTTLQIELEPKRTGSLSIPPLQVGNGVTEALVLEVAAADPAATTDRDIYLETSVSTNQPYVQQPLTYTVRLYYAIELINGGVQNPPPANASLQQIGEDRNYQQQIGARRYKVYEQRFLLIPERSGPLTLAAPEFRGRARRAGADPFFDRGQGVSVSGNVTELQVRPQPDGAPSPWLPAADLTLSSNHLPASTVAGEPLMLELKLGAEGLSANQLPELELPPIPGAQVFPETPQKQDLASESLPRAVLSRRFAIVPLREGELRLPELRIGFWNTTTDQADVAVLPPSVLTVTPSMTGITANPVSGSELQTSPSSTLEPGLPAQLWFWRSLSAALAAALITALAWGWRRGSGRPAAKPAVATPSSTLIPVQTALAQGELRPLASSLCASTGARGLGELASRLADPAQRAAVEELQSCLWAPGIDSERRNACLGQLRQALAGGLRMAPVKRQAADAKTSLAPLWPGG